MAPSADTFKLQIKPGKFQYFMTMVVINTEKAHLFISKYLKRTNFANFGQYPVWSNAREKDFKILNFAKFVTLVSAGIKET